MICEVKAEGSESIRGRDPGGTQADVLVFFRRLFNYTGWLSGWMDPAAPCGGLDVPQNIPCPPLFFNVQISHKWVHGAVENLILHSEALSVLSSGSR